MNSSVALGVGLAAVSGIMNGSFTMPMRFLGKWEWENVWSLFIFVSCILMPATIVTGIAPKSWQIIAHAPIHAVCIALLAGFAWGFGAIMFGQSVSAVGISLANTLVLAISSVFGSILPLLLLAPHKTFEPAGRVILGGVVIEVLGIVLCGRAGHLREQSAGGQGNRGDLVGHSRSLRAALLLTIGAGGLSAIFNIGFTLAQPIADYGRLAGLSAFASTNLIWWIMLAAGSVANLAYCFRLFVTNRSFAKFRLAGSLRLYGLSALMALLWGGSIFVYGAAVPRLGTLGTAVGWPLSLAIGLLLANAIGIVLNEWRSASRRTRYWLYSGISVLLIAIVVLSRAGE